MSVWNEIRELIDQRASDQVTRRVLELSDDERREVARELPGYVRSGRNDQAWDWGMVRADSLRVAGLGCIGGPAAAADWVTRRDLRSRSGPGERVVPQAAEVVAGRPAAWKAEVGRRIAARLRATETAGWQLDLWWLSAHLIREAGEPAPALDAFTIGWIATARFQPDRFVHDPFFVAAVPHIFEAEGIGRLLAWDDPARENSLQAALVAHIDRRVLLDGCVRRFLRGGTEYDLRWFVRLHESLAPTPAEVAERLRDYVRLLPVVPGPVAELAFARVRAADEAAPLDAALFAEVAGSLLFRAEKKIVRAALIWLDRTAQIHDRVTATVEAATGVFAADWADLADRAVKLAVKHAPRAEPRTGELVRSAAAGLPVGLRVQIAAAYGDVETVRAAEPAFGRIPVLGELWAPIASAAELADEAAAAKQEDFRFAGWADAERLLAGLVALGPSARAEIDRATWARTSWYTTDLRPRNGPNLILTALMAGTERVAAGTGRYEDRAAHRWSVPPLDQVIHARWLEAARRIGAQPFLLATPTEPNGQIDPDVLVDRLRRFEEAGLEPGPRDFEQALLRLPPAASAEATRLTSPAGRALRAWLENGGPPAPDVRTGPVKVLVREDRSHGDGEVPKIRVLPTASWDADLETARELGSLAVPEGEAPWDISETVAWWPATLPSHRELVAAHLLAARSSRTYSGEAEDSSLALALAAADGPAGTATAAILAHGLTVGTSAHRASAVGALLTFAARDSLPAADLGRIVPFLVTTDGLKLTRLAGSLALATSVGARLWPLFETLLPALLSEDAVSAHRSLPDLLSLATTAAARTPSTAPLPALIPLTSHSATTRLAREATRLHQALSSA